MLHEDDAWLADNEESDPPRHSWDIRSLTLVLGESLVDAQARLLESKGGVGNSDLAWD